MPMIAAARRVIFALHHRITAKIVIAILGGVGATVFVHTRLMMSTEARWMAEDFQTTARVSAAAAHSALAVSDTPLEASVSSPQGLLVSMRNASGAARIALVGPLGAVVVSSEPSDVGTTILSGEPRESIEEIGGTYRAVAPLHDGVCAVRDGPQLVQAVALVIDQGMDRHHDALHGSHGMLDALRLASMLASILLTLGVIWVVVQRPISQLMRGVTRIEQGEVDVHLETPARDEFGRMASGINSMLASLREKNHELQMLHETRLAQADRVASMGQLASGFAHEIKNPMHGIKSALTVIRSRIDPGTVEIIDEMLNQIDRVSHIVTDMLRYVRPRSSRFEMCRVDHVLNGTLMLLDATIKGHDIRIERDVADDLPETLADGGKLRQVFLNLVLNAVQATGDGGCVRISLRWDQRTHLIVCDVEDDGPGIPEETAARIFEPFFTTKKDGHGLGLATSRMLTEQNRGVLRLLPSVPGKGAQFQVLLPVIASAEPPPSDDVDADEDSVAVDEFLFGLACGCPMGHERNCPAESLRRIRVLDLTERREAIRNLDLAEKLRLRSVHIACARRHQEQDASAVGDAPSDDVRTGEDPA